MAIEQINMMDMLGDYVRHTRRKQGKTQQEIANLIGKKGINKNYISRLERKDLAGMNISTLEKLLGALDSSIKFYER